MPRVPRKRGGASAPTADEQVRQIVERMQRGEWGGGSHQELAAQWGLSLNTVYDRASEAGRLIRLAIGDDREAIIGAACAQLEAMARRGLEDPKYANAAVRAIELRLRVLRALDDAPPPALNFPTAREALAFVTQILPGLQQAAAAEEAPKALDAGDGNGITQLYQRGPAPDVPREPGSD